MVFRFGGRRPPGTILQISDFLGCHPMAYLCSYSPVGRPAARQLNYYPVAVEVGPWWYWLSATLAVNSLSQQNQTKMPWTLNRPWCDGYTHSLSSNTSDWHTRGPVHLCTGCGPPP